MSRPSAGLSKTEWTLLKFWRSKRDGAARRISMRIRKISLAIFLLAAIAPSSSLAQRQNFELIAPLGDSEELDDLSFIQKDSRPGPRMLEFPEDRSLGDLWYWDWPSDGKFYRNEWWLDRNSRGRRWTKLGPARGRVYVPAGKALTLRSGKVYGTDPKEDFSPLSNLGPNDLQRLDISSLTLTSADLVHLSGLSGLRHLSLRLDNYPVAEQYSIAEEGLAYLKGMKRLETLHLETGDEFQEESLVHLQELTSLRSLYLRSPNLGEEGLRIISQMSGIDALMIYGSGQLKLDADGLAHLQAMPNLQVLNIGHDITDDALAQVGKIKTLKVLFLQGVEITNEGFGHLSGLTNLRRLRLTRNTGIDGAALASLSDLAFLEDLDFGLTLIDDQGVDHLVAMRSLKYLDLRATHVSQGGYQRLRRGLPNSKIKYYFKQ